jgi:ornithine carbamoyltransferase
MHAQKALLLMLLGGAKRIHNSRDRGIKARKRTTA